MKDISRNGYSTDEIMAVLLGKFGSREIGFRYDLLDENENKKDELYEVTSGKIDMSALSDIKRTATFSLREETVTIDEVVEKKLYELPEYLKEW